MKLSIIIVNYNVRYFLEQCLYSVFKSLVGIDGEVIVVDNNSVDGSEGMVKSRFPNVKLIVNTENIGFAKANNQALAVAQGEYNLLLNPDTVIEESTLAKCLMYMDAHPEAGALGPKMINGKGSFLPESKRGLPTPEVAFYKIFGFTRLFPKSKVFGKYYLGYTSQNDIQEVEVLTGAFMFLRRKTIEDIGFFDDDFFMYGEDVDLSYRINKAGYKNIYFPETTIIHYKGESTKKGSLNYVMMFYKAMQIFAKKHLSGSLVSSFLFLISMAIYLRAGIALFKRSFVKTLPAILDSVTSYTGIYFICVWWEIYYFHHRYYYPHQMFYYGLPAFVAVMIFAILLSGGYRSPFNLLKTLRGIIYGTVFILALYALFPSEYRFSRALIIFGAVWTIVAAIAIRLLLSFTRLKDYQIDIQKKRRIVIIGSFDEAERVKHLLRLSGVFFQQIFCVFPEQTIPSENFVGTLAQLKEIIAIHDIHEVIFCAKDIPSQDIIKNMKLLNKSTVDFKIASPDSNSVIGSNSPNSSGDLYVINVNSLTRKKRLFKFF
jgi:O-antigen biosynthesis protein